MRIDVSVWEIVPELWIEPLQWDEQFQVISDICVNYL